MPRSPAQTKLAQLITAAIVPVLKPAGYRKSGTTFRCTTDACVKVVNVQSSRWSSAGEGSFTINLGVYFPSVAAAMSPVWPREIAAAGPLEYECHLRTRLGSLVGGPDWWSITATSGPAPEEISAPLRDHGLPWLERMSDLVTARAAADDLKAVGFALAAGDREGAGRALAELLVRKPDWRLPQRWAELLRSDGIDV